jgi:O-antigen/teichoic acid export membrane protein
MESKNTENSYTHILKYTGIFGGVQGIGILVGIIRNKLCAVILGPEGFGLISLLNSTVNFVSSISNLGLSFSAVRHISELFEHGDKSKIDHFINVVRAWSLLTALAGMLLCIVLSPLLNKWTFSWGDHTMHFILLSPMVAIAAITGGETAILKGTRRLRSLAFISIITVFASLFISVPIYYIWGESGIVPSLVGTALAIMLVTIWYSYHLYPLKPIFTKDSIVDGLGMLKLGVSFLFAGILGSGAELVIRSFLNNTSTLDNVGLYNAGYVIVFTYASMVFTAMETDYFPRLSSINHDVQAVNQTVNRQIEVSLLIISPMLVLFTIILPILMLLLYSSKFTPVVGMAQISVFSMFFRALTLPVSYITLAKGDSVAYLLLETIYDIVFVVLIIYGFNMFGLKGTGLALTIAGIIDFILINSFTHIRYKYTVSRTVIVVMSIQLPLLAITYALTYILNPWLYWSSGFIIFCVSSWISISRLHSKTSLWNSLSKKLKSKFRYE